MDEHLQEFVSSHGVAVRVDRDAGVIRGVKLLGLTSRNGRRYLPAALSQAVTLYEGSKVNVNHPKGSPLAARDYQDRLGAIRNVRHAEDGLFGDLHFNPKHALAEQLAWDAEHAPENVGFSHNVEARTSRQDGRTIVEAILKVQSVDLVADPATTRGLFESRGEAVGPSTSVFLSTITLETLTAARPDLVEALRADSNSELSALREELSALREQSRRQTLRDQALALFQEFELPDPATARGDQRLLAGEEFLEAVMAVGDSTSMRRLVAERAQLIAAARLKEGISTRAGRPTSREQQRSEPRAVALDSRSFARAIS